MKKIILVLGNITFEATKAIVHDIQGVVVFDPNEMGSGSSDAAELATNMGEEWVNVFNSYIVLGVYDKPIEWECDEPRLLSEPFCFAAAPLNELEILSFEYDGQKYPARELVIMGNLETISVESLSDKIIDDKSGLPIDSVAEEIDNQIFYYVSDEDFKLSDNELNSKIRKNL